MESVRVYRPVVALVVALAMFALVVGCTGEEEKPVAATGGAGRSHLTFV
jgi:hypothetical protein